MPDYAGMAMNGFAQGREMGMQMGRQRAMAALAKDPNNQRAIQYLQQVDPEGLAKHREGLLSQVREKLGMTVRLLDGATPEDYPQRVQMAREIGLDVSQIPQQFDPNWIAQTKMKANAMLGQVEQELMAVAPGTTVIDKHTGKEVYKNPERGQMVPFTEGGGGWRATTHKRVSSKRSLCPTQATSQQVRRLLIARPQRL